MKIFMNTAVVIALTLSAPIFAENNTAANSDATKGKDIAAGVCAGCHNADGNSFIPLNPILAGQHAEYITKQLIDFKVTDTSPAKRNSPVMTSMVAALSLEDMKSLGTYYAQQKTEPSTSNIAQNEALLKAGKIIYHGGNLENGVPACASCHSPNGSGIPPHYPALAGQHAEYTTAQLKAFSNGNRANDGHVMQTIVTRMSSKEKRAVAEYISKLR
ncbi:Cytochrome c553 [Nitrosomonas cryotolerans]|uniref:Cytochrome c553 n=1 Tax=Nitrosomonas cryotolerans ATCC 49181 TaxID=1131553 RepID=A0A1N6J7W8_9PROT|nr:c-type cytochrome [Nitrosomonas cryotolerans]SFP44591.1 Cytochrome c553 [Nitrosomonas cryotolerans]SIO40468.1 Cytochrome c553 [Nitrosomonas cryotolerans ATCC 49181]